MKLRILASIVLLVMIFTFPSVALAQDYTFSLDKEVVHIYWNADGTMSLDYNFFFTNDINGHVIDFVDVGMPTWDFNLNDANADVNGQALSLSSDFQGDGSYGFAVEMGVYSIQPGDSGQLHVFIDRVGSVLYESSEDPNYASAVFAPAYFTTAHGSTDFTVIYHFPPGVLPEEPRWYSSPIGFPEEPETAFDAEGRITYTWRNPQANGYTMYTFGASFPKSYVPLDIFVTEPVVPSSSPLDLGGIFSSITSFISSFGCCGLFSLLFVVVPILGTINERRRKLQYLPPKISIEGHGVKRGLTAVEAGILLEQPLDKIMQMILFGVVKKNAATVAKQDPLTLDVTQPAPEGLHGYENDFLRAFSSADLAGRRTGLQEMTVNLVKAVSDKLKGFSRKETVEYYKNIMERAWAQIEAAGTPEVKSQMFDESLEWTMLDKNYDDRTRRVFTGPVFVPVWWGRYDPGYHPVSTIRTGTSTPTISTGRSGPTSLPGSAFAASVVTGVQNFSSRVLGNVQTFTNSVTTRTNPVPKTSTTRSGGGFRSGGGGCACACACAGCACACAGGGR